MADQLPNDMSVVEMNDAGGPDVLVPGRRPIPEPDPLPIHQDLHHPALECPIHSHHSPILNRPTTPLVTPTPLLNFFYIVTIVYPVNI